MTTTSLKSEHDVVVRASANTYSRRVAEGCKVSVNPGGEHNFYMGGKDNPRYPDVVVWRPRSPGADGGAVEIIEEIETAECVNDDEAEQWVDYGNMFSGTFFLIVPKGTERRALSIIQKKRARVSQIYTYTLSGESVSFENTKLL
jgi:hypothetical protein